jgi:hypothetical protein
MEDATDARQLASQVDKLLGRLDAMLDLFERPGSNTSLVQNSTIGGGFATGIAVASCVATLLLMIAFMVIENRSYAHLDAQVDQLRAWNDVHSKEISRLQAQIQEKK